MSALPCDIRHAIDKLLDGLKTAGVFLVPVGELADWLATENITESKTKKPAWANAAAVSVLTSKGGRTGDIWDFVREVGGYLSQQ
jgi:hypothetical protein